METVILSNNNIISDFKSEITCTITSMKNIYESINNLNFISPQKSNKIIYKRFLSNILHNIKIDLIENYGYSKNILNGLEYLDKKFSSIAVPIFDIINFKKNLNQMDLDEISYCLHNIIHFTIFKGDIPKDIFNSSNGFISNEMIVNIIPTNIKYEFKKVPDFQKNLIKKILNCIEIDLESKKIFNFLLLEWDYNSPRNINIKNEVNQLKIFYKIIKEIHYLDQNDQENENIENFVYKLVEEFRYVNFKIFILKL